MSETFSFEPKVHEVSFFATGIGKQSKWKLQFLTLYDT